MIFTFDKNFKQKREQKVTVLLLLNYKDKKVLPTSPCSVSDSFDILNFVFLFCGKKIIWLKQKFQFSKVEHKRHLLSQKVQNCERSPKDTDTEVVIVQLKRTTN